MSRRALCAAVLGCLFLVTAARAEPPALMTASGLVEKADKDSLTIRSRGPDGRFGKSMTLKVSGTSRVTILTEQKRGGKLTVVRGQTVPQFDRTAFSLKTGQLSKPVHTQYGWHIIQALSAIRPASATPLSKVKDTIRQQLEQQKKNEVMTKWVDKKKKSYCKSGIKYQVGYQPNPDPCATVTGATTTTSQ